MTGLLPHNHGVLHVEHTVEDDQCVLRLDKPHFAQHLSRTGYRTGYFGKWHIERTNELEPFGWQESIVTGRKDLHPNHTMGTVAQKSTFVEQYHLRGPRGYGDRLHHAVVEQSPYERDMGAPAAAAKPFLDDALANDQPWCCCVSFSQPNEAMICGKEAFKQYDVDDVELPRTIDDDLSGRPGIYRRSQRAFASLTKKDWQRANAIYQASITELDSLFGELIDRIEAAGELDNTIIIFTSDHGKYVGEHGMDSHNFGAFEPIYTIPLVVAGPGVAQGQVSRARVGLHDLCPTLLELAGAEPIDMPDSKSFVPVLRHPEAATPEFLTGFAESEGTRLVCTQRVVWDGEWKFVFNGFDEDELYNLHDDPDEMTNLAADPAHRETLERMTSMMWQRARETGDTTILDTHYYPMRIAAVGPDA